MLQRIETVKTEVNKLTPKVESLECKSCIFDKAIGELQ